MTNLKPFDLERALAGDPVGIKILKNFYINKNKCWIWTKAFNGEGLPQLQTIYNKKFKNYLVHRLVYKICYKKLEMGVQIKRTCGDKKCINPSHFLALTLETRFSQKIKINKKNGCHEWTAKLDIGGYGAIGIKRRIEKAHRVSYELYVGKIPKDLYVLHKCDNRKCVNPKHLFLGTYQDNADDMAKKGRSTRGERSHSAKLKEKDIIKIRKMKKNCREISEIYGVHPATIDDIKRNRTWKYL